MAGKIRVGVLFGGQSSEHEVSLASARSVMSALDPEKYEVVPIGITKRGAWLTSGDAMSRLRAGDAGIGTDATPASLVPDLTNEGRAEIVQVSQGNAEAQVSQPLDVIFPVLHGPYGEDGTVQGVFQVANIPFVGAEVLGSAVGMDKDMMKKAFRDAGLQVVPYICVTRREWERDPASVQTLAEQKLQYPMFAKPANMGSSVGIGKIHGPEEFAAAVTQAARYDRRIVIEQGVDAREFEVAVLGNDEPEASVVGEIVPGNEFYDYRAKYVDDNSELIIPARIPAYISQKIRDYAIRAFRAIDASGMSRVDFFVSRDLSEVWVNEINTIPGFTRISMYPKLWEATGMPYSKLLDRLIELAIERHQDRKRNKEALNDIGGSLDV
ncbi:MAG: D-alanine--D-alanine ligase [Chloroflexota bacterium]|nr:D-alanine--D-alanine ligase [Chloroflexota bacterium]MDQ5867276.1 D-alanine--D-alanine ligase [Chloroflexota bacterium]